MECQKPKNLKNCTCLHIECARHGICCECLQYHLSSKELPACCFPNEISKTDERSFQKFVEINS